MKTDAVSVAQAFIAAINRHSVNDMGELMSEAHTFIDSLGRKVSGRQAMVAGWKAYLALFPDFEIHVESIVADNELVAIFGRACGTYNGKRGPVPENRIMMPCAWKAIAKDGKLELWQVYADWTEGMKTIERETGNG